MSGVERPTSDLWPPTSGFSDFLVFRVNIFRRRSHAIIARLHLPGDQQVVFSLQEVRPVINRKLKIVAVGDCVFGTRFDAVATENAATVVDVVNLGIALINADSLFREAGIIFGDDVNAIGRTSGSTKKTGHAFLAALLIN